MKQSQLMSNETLYRVLIVDDEQAQRTLEKEILSVRGFQVKEAVCGEDALENIRQGDFDAVLLDKRMPGMSGDEVCQAIRQDLNLTFLPLIMVTGTNATEELVASLNAGATDFVKKPYSPMELVARVSAAAKNKRITDQLDSAESMLFVLARMVEAKDEHTGDHCSRLSHLAVALGRQLGLGEEDLQALRRGGVLHDIGKLGIPDRILLKEGVLTDDEWVQMRQHPSIGALLCSGLKSMKRTLPIIRSHHERWDGGGYPDGLKGEDIPLLARVFQLVDIYDALTNERPYKKALPTEEVIAIICEERDKGWRDPHLCEVFLDILQHQPQVLNQGDRPNGDLGAEKFQDIVSTGALHFDQELQK